MKFKLLVVFLIGNVFSGYSQRSKELSIGYSCNPNAGSEGVITSFNNTGRFNYKIDLFGIPSYNKFSTITYDSQQFFNIKSPVKIFSGTQGYRKIGVGISHYRKKLVSAKTELLYGYGIGYFKSDLIVRNFTRVNDSRRIDSTGTHIAFSGYHVNSLETKTNDYKIWLFVSMKYAINTRVSVSLNAYPSFTYWVNSYKQSTEDIVLTGTNFDYTDPIHFSIRYKEKGFRFFDSVFPSLQFNFRI